MSSLFLVIPLMVQERQKAFEYPKGMLLLSLNVYGEDETITISDPESDDPHVSPIVQVGYVSRQKLSKISL